METKPGNLERRTRKALWQKAAKDPLFLKDIKDVESAFRTADAETALKNTLSLTRGRNLP